MTAGISGGHGQAPRACVARDRWGTEPWLLDDRFKDERFKNAQ
jgi:hypothetical protein